MDASIIVLGSPPTHDATLYAASLARFLAVPLLQVPLQKDTSGSSRQVRHRLGPATHAQQAGTTGQEDPAVSPGVPQQGLLLVLARPPARHTAAVTQQLLRASTLPLLLVPSPAAGRLPPRRIALAAAGKPFVLEQSLRIMHALLLTLPAQLIVLHAQLPHSIYSAADALHTVQACGLALRHLAIDGWDVPALAPAAGILAGVQQVAADLLVLPVWPRSRWDPAFASSVTARLLAQCPVPVLLLPVGSGRGSLQAA